MTVDRTLLSVVVPLYNEQHNLAHLAQRLLRTFSAMDFDGYEAILVSDGSTDATEPMISELVAQNPIFKGVYLTRNFGHQAAVSIGMAEAAGSVIAVLDGDLQDPPEALHRLVEALDRGADVAYGVRRKRKENLFKRVGYYAFYRTLRRLSSVDIPLDAGDFCAMRRCVLDDMLRLPERCRFVRGLRAWVGYNQVGVVYERHARHAGRTKYTWARLLGLAYDGMFCFSNVPVKLMQFAGFVVSCLAILTAVGYLGWYLLAPERFPTGWATLVISIWFIGGVQLMFMGIVGEYVFRTFDETRHRPTALVRRVLTNSKLSEEAPCDVNTDRFTPIFTISTGGGDPEKQSSLTRLAG